VQIAAHGDQCGAKHYRPFKGDDSITVI